MGVSRALNLWVCMLAFYHSACQQEPLVVWKQDCPVSYTVAVYANLKTFLRGWGLILRSNYFCRPVTLRSRQDSNPGQLVRKHCRFPSAIL